MPRDSQAASDTKKPDLLEANRSGSLLNQHPEVAEPPVLVKHPDVYIHFDSEGNPIKVEASKRRLCHSFKRKDDIKDPSTIAFSMHKTLYYALFFPTFLTIPFLSSFDTPLCRGITVTAALKSPIISAVSSIFSPIANFLLSSVGMMTSARSLVASLASALRTLRDPSSTPASRWQAIGSLLELTAAIGVAGVCSLDFGFLSKDTALAFNDSYNDIIAGLGNYSERSDIDAWVAGYCQDKYPNSYGTPWWQFSYYLNFASFSLVFLKASRRVVQEATAGLFRRCFSKARRGSASGAAVQAIRMTGLLAYGGLAMWYATPRPSSALSTDMSSILHFFHPEYLFFAAAFSTCHRLSRGLKPSTKKQHGFLPDLALTLLNIASVSAFVPMTSIAMNLVDSNFAKLCIAFSPLVYSRFIKTIGVEIKKDLILLSRITALILSAPFRCMPCFRRCFKHPEEMSAHTWTALTTELGIRGLTHSPFLLLAYLTSFSMIANVDSAGDALSPFLTVMAKSFGMVRVFAFNASILLTRSQRSIAAPIAKRVYAAFLARDRVNPTILLELGWACKQREDGRWVVWMRGRSIDPAQTNPSYADIVALNQHPRVCRPLACQSKKIDCLSFLRLFARSFRGGSRCVTLQSIASFVFLAVSTSFIFTIATIIPLAEFDQLSSDQTQQDFFRLLASVFIGMLTVRCTFERIPWFGFTKPVAADSATTPLPSRRRRKRHQLQMRLLTNPEDKREEEKKDSLTAAERALL